MRTTTTTTRQPNTLAVIGGSSSCSSKNLPFSSSVDRQRRLPPRLTETPAVTSTSHSDNDDDDESTATTTAGDDLSHSTVRRLPNEDVRAIFECLHNHGPKPPHLDFSIVPIGPNGQKLSPPPHEFEAGLYVLLRPEKRPKHKNQPCDVPKPPPHLEHLMLQKQLQSVCPWQLSGPQFPHPTAIQQRYCYPKGRPDYSSRIGGALWTMYGADGKEDVEFRLLHVYYSPKRAVNKGMSLPATASESTPTKIKRRKRDSDYRCLHHSPAVTASSMSQTSRSSSSPHPGYDNGTGQQPSLAPPYPYHPHHNPYHHHLYPPAHHHHPHLHYNQQYLHPEQVGLANQHSGSKEVFRRFRGPEPTHARHGAAEHTKPAGMHYSDRRRHEPPVIRRMHSALSYDSLNQECSSSSSVVRKTTMIKNIDSGIIEAKSSSASVVEPFDIDTGSLKDIDSYWNDPLLSIMLKPSHDKSMSEASEVPLVQQKAQGRTLMARLETLQLSIRELILQAPTTDEQEQLLSMVTTWAEELSHDPLSDPMLSRQPSVETDISSFKGHQESVKPSTPKSKEKLKG